MEENPYQPPQRSGVAQRSRQPVVAWLLAAALPIVGTVLVWMWANATASRGLAAMKNRDPAFNPEGAYLLYDVIGIGGGVGCRGGPCGESNGDSLPAKPSSSPPHRAFTIYAAGCPRAVPPVRFRFSGKLYPLVLSGLSRRVWS